MNTTTSRPYRMSKRAADAEATGERILDAATELFMESFEMSIRAVAERAGVTEQTVIRRFGGKRGLFEAAAARELERIASQRDEAVSRDLPQSMAVLVEHYEQNGESVLHMLAHEDRFDEIAEIARQGRDYHQRWCSRVFADHLSGLPAADRKRRLAQLIAVTDVYTWKILRLDRRLSRPQTERAMRELAESLTGGAR